MAKNFQGAYPFMVPSWLSADDGGKVLDSITGMLDRSLDRMRAALDSRFPTRAQPDANALTGNDRGIPRGRAETDAHYAQRLIGWRYPRGHRVRGSAFALLNQVSEYFGGVKCFTIDFQGNRHDRFIDGEEFFGYGNGWTWDTDSAHKARFWIVLLPGVPFPYVRDDVDAIRNLFRGKVKWKPAGTRQEWLIVSTHLTDGAADEPFPDATWEHWSKVVGGHRLPSRDPTFLYWSLAPTINNAYAGDRTVLTTDFPLTSGGTYAGNRANFSTIALTGGGSYLGDRSNFPTTITLLDDGNTL